MRASQTDVYNYLIGQSEAKYVHEIAEALGMPKVQASSACTNLKRKGVIAAQKHNGIQIAWAVVPGVPFKASKRGGDTTGGKRSGPKRGLSTHPGVLRLRAAMDELMEAFIAIESNVVSDSDLRALDQVRAVARHLIPSGTES